MSHTTTTTTTSSFDKLESVKKHLTIPYIDVKVVETPISRRYCTPGDICQLDVENQRIRCGGAWFGFDSRWKVETVNN